MSRGRPEARESAIERFRRVDAVFDEVLDVPPDRQAAFLDEACRDDAQLRSEVEALLRAWHESEGMLEAASALIVAPLLHGAGVNPAPVQAGPFRIVREIGRGGMGAVYLAERADGQFEQRVALKLIRSTVPGLVRRFLAERRILAKLEHPGIARLIDGGIVDGSPYFAMELVDGQPIDRYCAERALSLDARLDLFVQVCDAVAYAHAHLVIHRDLKPANILVTAGGQVKLLDFGIATLLDDAAPDEEGRTEIRALTPEFAAPEQVRGEAAGTATDIYALGVLLYLLVSGDRPYDARNRTPAELERIVCQDDPEPPSRRCALPWAARLRGDIDAIVLMALRKDPEQRYASVQRLVDDIDHLRSGHPVHARRGTGLYRARRFATRHRWSVAALATIGVLAGAYVASMAVQQARITRALAEARTGAARAEQVTDFMLGLFEASDRGSGLADTVTVRTLLERGEAAARDYSGPPEVRAQMLDAVGRLHMQLADFAGARKVFEDALAARRQVLGGEHADVATSLANLAGSLHELGRHDSATALYRRALAMRRRTLGDDDPATMDVMYSLATALHRSGERAAARQLFDEWMVRAARQSAESTDARAHQYVLLGQLLMYGDEPGAAVEMIERAVQVRTSLFGERHPAVARTLAVLAGAHLAAGRFVDAEQADRRALEILREVHPDGHPDVVRTLRGVAVALHRQHRWEEAEAMYTESLAMAERLHGAEHTFYAIANEDLAMLLLARGHHVRAEPYARRAFDVFRRQAGPESLLAHRAATLLGDALVQRGDYAAAEPLLLASYAALSARPVPGFPVSRAAAALATLYDSTGRSAQAARLRDQAGAAARR